MPVLAKVGGGIIISIMSYIKFSHTYDNIISLENLLLAWKEFIKGKRSRRDVQMFEKNLMDNLFDLHHDLKNKTYKHGSYQAFKINDTKPRDIHKATVRDRLLHHAIYRILYPFFDKTFIVDSYSCRINKGTHKAINRFRDFSRKVSKNNTRSNNTRSCLVLKCDIRKFFANIDHKILKNILARYITDQDILWLLGQVIDSFSTSTHISDSVYVQRGLPLGNLTSQLLVNIYMNEFDQFMKRELKVKYYIRYADDFVILSDDQKYLEDILLKISEFLENRLKLQMHPDKVYIKTLASGVDFLGWINFPSHRVLRTSTKRRMFRNLQNNPKEEVLASYLGYLSHGDGYKLRKEIEEFISL